MGKIKDRKDKDLTEAEDIKRWQKYTEELYKKDLHNPDNHDGVITHLEPDILECEVKWALEGITTNKASGGDGIPEIVGRAACGPLGATTLEKSRCQGPGVCVVSRAQ